MVSLLVLAVLTASAQAADPIMPLSDVRAGMKCSALSVIRGLEPARFDAEILDVVEGDPTSDGPRILVSVSGAAVDVTGLGPGFSGSPIYCPDSRGVAANVGAISEAIGEYGGKVALATPIEAILGNPPDAPAGANPRRDVSRHARKLTEPLTVSGLSGPLVAALDRAGAQRGIRFVTAPSGPLTRFPPQILRPGSAMGVGYSSGDITVGGVGTVAYVDGDRVWSFGHELDAAGRRNLLLQDAYVYRVINNPLALGALASTYKLAAPSHTVGTLSNDAITSVVGRLGAPPRTVAVRVSVRDQDTQRVASVDTQVADETDIQDPLGIPLVAAVAPLAVVQATAGILKSAPGKVSGDMCARIDVRELARPVRFCNRYVSNAAAGLDQDGAIGNGVATAGAADVEQALSLIGDYTGRPLHVTGVTAGVRVRRGADLAFMRKLELPARVRAGQTVQALITVQRLRGAKQVLKTPLRMPADLDPGSHRIVLRGTDADDSDTSLLDSITVDFSGGEGNDSSKQDGSDLDKGPQSLRALTRALARIDRFDGVKLFVDRERGKGARTARVTETRLAGRVSARVRAVKRGRVRSN